VVHGTNDLHRASQIFDIEQVDPGSPLADNVWRARSVPLASFTSVATPYWQMVVTRHRDRAFFTVRGPETRPSVSPIPQDAEFVGVQFRLGTFISRFSASQLVDRAIYLPNAGRRTFWLDGSAWELPTFDNVDVFVRRLMRKGLVGRDPIVEAAMQGRVAEVSLRTVQRRIQGSTGLTHATILQIERARRAVALLDRGHTIMDVVAHLGYADQPHLTRALSRFIGHTPGQVAREQRAVEGRGTLPHPARQVSRH
jgi:AraC-like DNA-binding protein